MPDILTTKRVASISHSFSDIGNESFHKSVRMEEDQVFHPLSQPYVTDRNA